MTTNAGRQIRMHSVKNGRSPLVRTQFDRTDKHDRSNVYTIKRSWYHNKMHKARTFSLASHTTWRQSGERATGHRAIPTHLPGSRRSHSPRNSVEEAVDGPGPWNVKSSMSGSERLQEGTDLSRPWLPTERTGLPCDDLFAAFVRVPIRPDVYRPTEFSRADLSSLVNGSMQALNSTFRVGRRAIDRITLLSLKSRLLS